MAKIKAQYPAAVCGDCIMAEAGYSETDLGRHYSVVHPPLSLFPQGAHAFTFSSIGEDDKHFSWQPCQGCNEQLGGDRFDVTVTEWA